MYDTEYCKSGKRIRNEDKRRKDSMMSFKDKRRNDGYVNHNLGREDCRTNESI